jgi:hypothetical protein
LSTPLSARALAGVGLEELVRGGRYSRAGHHHLAPHTPLGLDDEQWRVLVDCLQSARDVGGHVSPWPIEPGTFLWRNQVHDLYGGPRGRAECSSPRSANDLLFVDRQPDDPELVPRWSGGVLSVPGQSQQGSVDDQNGSVLVTSHLRRGRALRVFEARSALCLYLGEFVIDQSKPIDRWVDAGRRTVRTRRRFVGEPPGRGPLRDYRVAVLRLRQLDGIEAFAGSGDPFVGAGPVNLALQALSDSGDCEPDEPQQMADVIRGLVRLVEMQPEAALAIENVDALEALSTLVQRVRRRAELDALREAVQHPDTTERDLQSILERMPWVFGGSFLSKTGRRALTTSDQLDLSLIRPDGWLHGVEIKRAHIPRLIRRHRNHFVTGHEVNEAVGQAMNYLRGLDEERHRILNEHEIDTRRAGMSVVIGSARFVPEAISAGEIAQTIRTFNSYVSRVQVITYDQLIDDAQRALTLAAG